MRASKEEATSAIENLKYLEYSLTDQKSGKWIIAAFEHIMEFLVAAKRKLPTQSAYDREATKRNVGRRAKR